MKKHRCVATAKVFCALVIIGAMFTLSGCVGACDGTSDILGTYYCYDDFSAEECEDYDLIGVNDASWAFHSGLTCADL